MQTTGLYYGDMYKNDFDAKVIEIVGNKVVLSQTCFYPEGGGQAGDSGFINHIKVFNTVKEGAVLVKVGDQKIPTGGKIYHLLEKEPDFLVGDVVRGKIDWDKRYKTMKLHSASHITEHYLFQVFGVLPRIGTCVDYQKDRSDYQTDIKFDAEKLMRVQNLVNRFIEGNHEIMVYQSPENEYIRVWVCGPLKMYCGGTHIKNTSEIGRIRLKRNNKGAGKERVETYLES